jgi:hypothetical protein
VLPVRYGRNLCILIGRNSIFSPVKAGSNTLRVVGGDEKGSLESETVKYGRESHGTRTQE